MTLTATPFKVQDPQQKIKGRAIYYLAKREYSATELSQKLERAFPEQHALVATVIAALLTDGALSNDRFLESRVRHRLAQGYGPEKIRHELKSLHGFSSDAIRTALENTEVSAEAQLHAVLNKKFPHLDVNNPHEKNRAIRFLMQRGFSYSILSRAFSDL